VKKNLPFRIWAVLASVAILGAAAIVESMSYSPRGEIRLSPRDIPQALRQSRYVAANLPVPPLDTGAAAPASSAPTSNADYSRIAFVVGRLLTDQHYLHHPLDATISNRLFDHFLDMLDPQRLYFLQSDLDEWAPLRDELAAKIKSSGDTTFSQTAFGRFKERFEAQNAFALDTLKTAQFTFTGDDTIQLDRKTAARPKDLDAAKALWLQQLRFEYLQEKLNHKKPDEIVQTLTRRYTRLAKNFQEDEGPDEIFELYLKNLCFAFDPHSEYFGKASSEEFSISMNVSLVGIGAQLESQDGYVKIVNLIPGGPAFKSKKLKAGDRIVGVAQDTAGGDVVDVVDMNLSKVVEMIRGTKGTTVRLVIQPAAATDPATRQTIALVRDEVKLEDKSAKAEIIETPSGIVGGKPTRLGVISLPSFYGGGPDAAHHATEDIARLIKKLKEAAVSGIVLDLRGNPGGSLNEAIGTVGLFIKQGPVVQSRYANGQIEVQRDTDPSIAWDGPLVVLTSHGSASASEIVTGALRDYGRAVVVGDSQTFGKSTVQEIRPLKEIMDQVNLQTASDPGSLHLTIAMYFLPGGKSTQLTGVPSDIVIPSPSDIIGEGEKMFPNPLKPAEIKPSTFDRVNRVQPYLAELRRRSGQRVAHSTDFAYLESEIARLKKTIADKTVSLNEQARDKERMEAEARAKARKKILAARAVPNERIYAINLNNALLPGLPQPLKAGKIAEAHQAPDASTLSDDVPAAPTGPAERDLTLDEAQRILQDYIALSKK
jgi:carboxyl-terminal processing protease